jgi:hypothetical protein
MQHEVELSQRLKFCCLFHCFLSSFYNSLLLQMSRNLKFGGDAMERAYEQVRETPYPFMSFFSTV